MLLFFFALLILVSMFYYWPIVMIWGASFYIIRYMILRYHLSSISTDAEIFLSLVCYDFKEKIVTIHKTISVFIDDCCVIYLFWFKPDHFLLLRLFVAVRCPRLGLLGFFFLVLLTIFFTFDFRIGLYIFPPDCCYNYTDMI